MVMNNPHNNRKILLLPKYIHPKAITKVRLISKIQIIEVIEVTMHRFGHQLIQPMMHERLIHHQPISQGD